MLAGIHLLLLIKNETNCNGQVSKYEYSLVYDYTPVRKLYMYIASRRVEQVILRFKGCGCFLSFPVCAELKWRSKSTVKSTKQPKVKNTTILVCYERTTLHDLVVICP